MNPAEARDKRWIALGLLCVAQFVVVLDASIVNVALPTIKEALNFSEDSLPWVLNAYVLTFGGFLLLGAGSPTCSAGGASSWAAWCSSRSPRWQVASPPTRGS